MYTLLNKHTRGGVCRRVKNQKEKTMKNAKKILILLLSLAMIFALFACGKCKHSDEDDDGICDLCEEEMEVVVADVPLIEGAYANFQFVVSDDASTNADVKKAVDTIVKTLDEDYYIDVANVPDRSDNIQDIEVLIGDVTTRGKKYQIDKHTLGIEGYVIKIVGTKVIINAGSYEKLAEAIEEFGDDIIGLIDEPDEIWDVIMTPDQIVEYIQDDYRITALKINETDIKGYTIAIDESYKDASLYKTAAQELQDLLYKRAGYWLEIVDIDNADKSIIIKHVDKNPNALPKGFKISVNSNGQMVIECAYDNMLSDALDAFAAAKIILANGEINFTGNVYDAFEASVINYDDFGAKGDGKTNDYKAIYEAHVKANAGGQLVTATAGKTYYLESPVVGGTPVSIPVMTNVNWNGAKFIVDDRKIGAKEGNKNNNDSWNRPVFSVQSDFGSAILRENNANQKKILDKIIADGLNRDTKKIDLGDGFKYGALLITSNEKHNLYRRKGYGAYAGVSMTEVIVIDKDGNVSPDTPIAYDYIALSSLEILKLDGLEPITLENGEFTTRASQYNCIRMVDGVRDTVSPYISRGIVVNRSYTTVKNVTHKVTDEAQWSDCVNSSGEILFVGSTYRGFYYAERCSDVLFEDCVVTGRRCYRRPAKSGDGTGGTYDLGGDTANNITFKGCTQTNFWITVSDLNSGHVITPAKEGDQGAQSCMEIFPTQAKTDDGGEVGYQMYWGVGGTNLCKNFVYEDCMLSRYDAHEGLYGGKIINSTVTTIALTGGGEMLLKDSRIFPTGTNVFTLREDYGSPWNGSITIDNLQVHIDSSSAKEVTIMKRVYNNWYYGYLASEPSISINDLVYYYGKNFTVDDSGPERKITYEQVPSDVPVYLCTTQINSKDGKAPMTKDTTIHLDKTTFEPIYSVEDKDKDGYVDIPDTDGDGKWGNTAWEYEEIKKSYGSGGFLASKVTPNYEPPTDGLYDNFSKTPPPAYIKILSNKGNYKYYVMNTGGLEISNGGHYGVAENNKGFYGSTKFYYNENEYYQGPPTEAEKNPNDTVFVFY